MIFILRPYLDERSADWRADECSYGGGEEERADTRTQTVDGRDLTHSGCTDGDKYAREEACRYDVST